MFEPWLQTNRRALQFGAILPLVIAVAGASLMFAGGNSGQSWMQWLGIALASIAFAVLAAIIRQIIRPRIAYRDGHVLFNLRAGAPIAVPAEFVEAFFIGQGPAHLPGRAKNESDAMNLVARLAQRQTDWATRDVKPAFGKWCDGYITVRGTWCEPLNQDVVRRLNRRLKEVKTADEGAARH